MFIEKKPVIEVWENYLASGFTDNITIIAFTAITVGFSQFCLIEGSLGLPGGIPHWYHWYW